MLKVITDNESTKVVYDSEKKEYIKTFYKNKRFRMRIRLKLGLKEYPGYNFKKTINLLSDISNVICPEVISYDKYIVITKEIEGKTLYEKLLEENNRKKIEEYIEKYINIVSEIIKKLYKKRIYYNDFHFGNFIVDSEDKFYIIDLEGFTKDIFFEFHKKGILKGLKKLLSEQEVLYNKGINPEEIYNRIEKILKEGKNI